MSKMVTLKDETANSTNAVSFVNIKTEKFYDFESWDSIVKQGGLNKILPSNDWDMIFNEKACYETLNQVIADILLAKATGGDMVRICSKNSTINIESAIEYLKPFEKAISLFHKRN